jgi:putative sigma-54 modulation protein
MLTMEEATMRIDLSGDNFLVYRGEEDQKIKVMYVRRDKTLGVIEVQ